MKETDCSSCDGKFVKLGVHLSRSDCQHPTLSQKQREIITGVMMGDGSAVQRGKYPNIQVGMINKEYLHHLDEMFDFYGLGVVDHTTPDNESHSKSYMWKTRTSPEFIEYRDWYGNGGKEFPESIRLTPLVLRHWYVCDGTYRNGSTKDYVKISVVNKRKNKGKIETYLSDLGIEVSNWTETKNTCAFTLSKSMTEHFFDVIGSPPPGFEYKWPDRKI